MNQQDIINNINNSLVDFNVRWSDIQYMADKAILKINTYMCANYPLMSDILHSPEHTYTVHINNADIPIFPERYIHTIVIPFIQSEVLARDEEFTTIYNKYVLEYENGLFDMVSNEYNRVPVIFRQPKESGVFFTSEQTHKQFSDQYIADIPEFKCSIYYHINNPNIMMTTLFTNDTNKYNYGETVKILGCVDNPQFTDIDGYEQSFFDIQTENKIYKFAGWTYNERLKTIDISITDLNKSKIITVKGDVHLYAVWNEESIFDMQNGKVSLKKDFAGLIYNLVIPDNINGYPVLTIAESFDAAATNLLSITLPKTVTTIESNAFTQPTLACITFPKYNYLFQSPNIELKANAINLSATNKTYNLATLHLPYSVRTIAAGGINVGNNPLSITCEIDQCPADWETTDDVMNWYTGDNVKVAWGVSDV